MPVSDRNPDAALDVAIDGPLPAPVAYFNFNGNRTNKAAGDMATCDPNCPDTSAAGKLGEGAAFNGSNDCLFYPPTGLFPSLATFTVAFWLNDSTDTQYALVGVPHIPTTSTDDSWIVETDTSMTIRYTTYFNGPYTVTAPASFTIGEWHHVAVTFSGDAMEIYVDGVPKTRTALLAGVQYDSAPALRIGCDVDNGFETHLFAGTLDELYVFASVLTDPQIALLATP